MEGVGQALAAGVEPEVAADLGLLSLWRTSAEVMPLLSYIASTSRTEAPLHIGGFDNQLTTSDRGAWVDAIAAVFAQDSAGARAGRLDALRSGFRYWRQGGRSPDSLNAFIGTLQALIGDLDRARSALEQDLGYMRVEIVRRSLEGRIVQIGMFADFFRSSGGFVPATNNPRDRRMADNILWMVNERFPNERVVLWLASSHATPILEELLDLEGEAVSAGMVTAGHYLRASLGDEYYLLGLTGSHGYHGTSLAPGSTALEAPPSESLEALFDTTEADLGFVDFRAARHASVPRVTRVMGLFPLTGEWQQALDGALWIRQMTPSHPR